MKKTILAAFCATIAVSASAQNVTDALRYSQNDYYGTARSIAMGNAFTALGGDLGSITINPAGSAVNNYSQFTVTPSINILAGTASYSGTGFVGDGNGEYISNNSSTRFTMPNLGLVMNYNTHRKHGLKSISFGIVGNATSYYNDNMYANGPNGKSSYMGYLSALAESEGLSIDDLNKASYWDMDPYYWPAMVGYRSGMINEMDGHYLSPAEGFDKDGNIVMRGTLDESFNRVVRGNKYDLVMNFGMNFNNKLFLGANLGIVDLSYKYNSYLGEQAYDSHDFPMQMADGTMSAFNSMKFRHSYGAEGSGIYAKIGVIAVPFEGFRIGAAIQTPTANYINERMWYSGATEFDGGYEGSETIYQNDEYAYEYKLVSPMRANVGIAYTIPGLGLVSADYEFCDYYRMKFREANYYDHSAFDDANQSIHEFAGASHSLRLGAEFIPAKGYALRAGYNLTTSGERYYDSNGNCCTPSGKQSVAFGAGYKSPRSFFCDAALRCNILPAEYVYPYDTYDDIATPEILVKSNLWNLVFTFGWRF